MKYLIMAMPFSQDAEHQEVIADLMDITKIHIFEWTKHPKGYMSEIISAIAKPSDELSRDGVQDGKHLWSNPSHWLKMFKLPTREFINEAKIFHYEDARSRSSTFESMAFELFDIIEQDLADEST